MYGILIDKIDQVINGMFEMKHNNQRQDNWKMHNCPNCENEGKKFSFYACCLEPYCKNCYDGFHYFECKKRIGDQNNGNMSERESDPECQRCDKTLKKEYYICRQCNNARYCQECNEIIHRQGKFMAHQATKSHIILRGSNSSNSKNQILKCNNHKKIRNIISQKGSLICASCASEHKLKKVKIIDFFDKQSSILLKDVQGKIQSISQQFWLKQEQNSRKWSQLKTKVKEEYEKILFKLKDRLEQNISILQKLEQFDSKVIQQAVKHSKKSEKQLQWGLQYVKNTDDTWTFIARLNVLNEELMGKKKLISSTQCYSHKIGQIQMQKLETLFKNFTVQKIKVKENDERQSKINTSLKKSNHSLSKHRDNSLANSRKSLSKSITKNQDLRASTKTLGRSQQLQSSTSSGKKNIVLSNYMNSGKKNGYNSGLAKHSILSAKMDEMNIQPTTLSFDAKELNSQSSIRSKINFSSSKTEQNQKNEEKEQKKPEHQQILSSFSSVNNQNSVSGQMFSRVNKRKSDYFDLRERMRKPNVVNNRFARK